MVSDPGSVDDNWPAIGSESRTWTPTIPRDLVPRATWLRHTGPYEAALVPSISDRQPRLPPSVVALEAEATAAIARFDAESGADLAPFEVVLLRSESASSSMIENLTAGAKAVLLAEMGSSRKRNAVEIAGNVAAMRAALAAADQLDEAAVLSMHGALMQGHDPGIAGRWREQQVWIGGDAYGPHGAAFVAPHHDHVPRLMGDLIRFLRRDDLPTLTQAAIAHAQFDTIHPFPDGNGRTGRALVHALLRAHRLTRSVTVPVSAGLLTDTGGYVATLTAYREGDVVPVVEILAHATFTSITNAYTLIGDLRDLREGWSSSIRSRRGAATWALADLVLRQPVVDVSVVARELGLSVANALRPVGNLVEAGVLTEFTGFARNRMWQATQVLEALDAFAARAGRRAPGRDGG